MGELAAEARIDPPRLGPVLRRWRLFERLDKAREGALTLVHGPPGSGKSTLVSSYVEARGLPCLWHRLRASDQDPASLFAGLSRAAAALGAEGAAPLPQFEPEDAPDLASFSRRFFRILFARCLHPLLVVFEDDHAIPDHCAAEKVIRGACLEMPPRGHLVLIGRWDSHGHANSLFGARGVTAIGWEDLRFTDEEALQFAALKGCELSLAEAARLNHGAGGHAQALGERLGASPAGEAGVAGQGTPAPGTHAWAPSHDQRESAPQSWPIRIYTLGRFSVVRDGAPLRFTGKAQREPLNLLKAVIALGGRDVSAQRVVAALWPESEGDKGEQALATNLFRLRKLIGHDAVRRQEGRLSLDAQHCWVDCWALTRLLNDRDPLSLERLHEAAALYQRPFLSAEENAPWSLSLRERLHVKVLHFVSECARVLRSAGHLEDAVQVYVKGLEIDDLVEEFYQGLMDSLAALGRKSEAALVYRRCQKVLSARLGLEPSRQTTALYHSLFETQ